MYTARPNRLYQPKLCRTSLTTLFDIVLSRLVTSTHAAPKLPYAGWGRVLGSVNPLLGRSVLIVEDEPLIALELQNALCLAGASILAATNIKDALQLIGHARISAAIVDVNLGGRDCSDVCAALTKSSIPFMFYTGYSTADALPAWPDAPAVRKPAQGATMVDTIMQLLPSQVAPRACRQLSHRTTQTSRTPARNVLASLSKRVAIAL